MLSRWVGALMILLFVAAGSLVPGAVNAGGSSNSLDGMGTLEAEKAREDTVGLGGPGEVHEGEAGRAQAETKRSGDTQAGAGTTLAESSQTTGGTKQTEESQAGEETTRTEVKKASGARAKTLEAQFRKLWAFRADSSKAKAILEALDRWVGADPENAEAYILLSRATYWFVSAFDFGGTREEKMALLAKGIEAGKRAAQLDPKNPGGEFWAVTNLGTYGKIKGIMESVSTYGEIRERLAKVEKIDPKYFYGGLWRYYGRLIDQVPASLRFVYGYDLDDAVEDYKKAIEIEPNYQHSYFFMAECLLQKEERDLALKVLRDAIKRDPNAVPEVYPENWIYLRRNQALLRKEFPGVMSR